MQDAGFDEKGSGADAQPRTDTCLRSEIPYGAVPPGFTLPLHKIESALETICREEGWNVHDLAESISFETTYHRLRKGNHRVKFPPKARFVYLGGGIDATHSGYHFIVGLGRTEKDPWLGAVDQNWSFYKDTDIVETDDVTAFAKFILFNSGKLYVHEIQASVINDQYEEMVANEMKSMPPGPLHTEKRIYNLHRYGVPWHYADRLLLFGPMAVWFARMTDAQAIIFERLNDLPIHLRAYKYLTRHVHTDGIAVAIDSRPQE